MQIVEGVLQQIFTKNGVGRGGKPYTIYSLKVNNDMFGLGFSKPPGVVEGATVKFVAIPDPRNPQYNKVQGDVEIVAGPSTAPAASSASATTSASSGPVDWDGKDRRIVYQSSRKDAIEVVKLLVETGGLKLGAKENAKVSIIEDAIDLYTNKFFGDVYGDLQSKLEPENEEPDYTYDGEE